MSYDLTIEPLGVTVQVEDEQTLLDAALRAGIWLPHACNHGLCSSCKAELIEGEIEHGNASPFALMDYERDEGMLLTCSATAESDLVIEVDIEIDADARQIPVEDFNAAVVDIQHPDLTMLVLKLKAERFFDFQPGQYLNLNVPGIDGPRAFSVASLPDDELIELHIRLVPNGAATEYLHNKLETGDLLTFSGPYGQFFLRDSRQEPALLLAAGSGLSGVLGMARQMLQVDPQRSITLYHGVRTEPALYADEVLKALQEQYTNFQYCPVLSQPGADQPWSGRVGHVQRALAEDLNEQFTGHVAYICGSPAMVEGCISTLIKGRLFERDIFVERFYNAENANSVKRSKLFKTI